MNDYKNWLEREHRAADNTPGEFEAGYYAAITNAINEYDGPGENFQNYRTGVIDTLRELADVFDGVEDTDLWKEHLDPNGGEN
jgi:hypothetical protein